MTKISALTASLLISMLSSTALASTQKCNTNLAPNLVQIYLTEGLSGLISVSKECHAADRNCFTIDVVGYEFDRQFCQANGCERNDYFDRSEFMTRQQGVDPSLVLSKSCVEMRELVKDILSLGG